MTRTILCLAVVLHVLVSMVTSSDQGHEVGTLNDTELDGNYSDHGNDTDHHEPHGVHLASINLDYVKEPLMITLFLLVVAICKLGFHHADVLSSHVPESCLLIVLGTVVGAILFFTGTDQVYNSYFTSGNFFLYLLPPIILEAAYSLHDRVFFENLGSILIYAVVGTIINCFVLAPVLYGLALCGAMGTISISLIQCFVFASLIVAVDPVAVLAIFQEIGVNNVLYFIVFGESLLNDAVTVVIYNTMKAFNEMDTIPVSQIFLGIASFFTVSLGGLAIGLLIGILCSFLTKFTQKVRLIEPLAMFTLAYLSYLLAELFHFSGIISIIACGLVQAQYAFHNISHKSLTTITYFGKVMSATCDCIIFMFLGLSLVSDSHVWHTGFVLWTIILTLGIRFGVVYFLTFMVNRFHRLRKIDWEEQFIMAYGGLRGAVAFSLVAMLDKKTVPNQPMFETTTLAVIIFTVFVQGITIKPLVKLLRISSGEKNPVSIYEEINNHVTDHVMAGVEEILGHLGHNVMREKLDHFDDRYLRRYLMRDPTTKDCAIMETYQKMAIQMHFENTCSYPLLDEFTSQMELYKPELLDIADPDELPMDSDLAHRSLDVHGRAMSLAYPDVMLRHRSRLSRGFSLALPTYPWSPTRMSTIHGGSASPKLPPRDQDSAEKQIPPWTNFEKQTSPLASSDTKKHHLDPKSAESANRQSAVSDDVFLDQNDPERIQKAGESMKELVSRKQVIKDFFHKLSAVANNAEDPEEVTTDNVRKWLVKNPSRQALHRKYDRNLTHDDNTDLVHHLNEKRKRSERRRYSVMMRSPTAMSVCSTPRRSPFGSQEAINARPLSMLGIIEEGKVTAPPNEEVKKQKAAVIFRPASSKPGRQHTNTSPHLTRHDAMDESDVRGAPSEDEDRTPLLSRPDNAPRPAQTAPSPLRQRPSQPPPKPPAGHVLPPVGHVLPPVGHVPPPAGHVTPPVGHVTAEQTPIFKGVPGQSSRGRGHLSRQRTTESDESGSHTSDTRV